MANDVNDATFEQEVLAERRARARRLLGGVVRPVPRRRARARRIAAEREDELKLVKVNIDEEHELAAALRRRVDPDA